MVEREEGRGGGVGGGLRRGRNAVIYLPPPSHLLWRYTAQHNHYFREKQPKRKGLLAMRELENNNKVWDSLLQCPETQGPFGHSHEYPNGHDIARQGGMGENEVEEEEKDSVNVRTKDSIVRRL